MRIKVTAKHYYRLQNMLGLGGQLLPMRDLAKILLDHDNAKQPQQMTQKKAKRIAIEYMRRYGIIYNNNINTNSVNSCYVYIIQQDNDEAPIKIGMSDNPEKRLKQMQTGSAYPLLLVAKICAKDRTQALYMEKGMHEKLSKFRLNGEWFSNDAIHALRNNPSIA